jgi:hypothetical protein
MKALFARIAVTIGLVTSSTPAWAQFEGQQSNPPLVVDVTPFVGIGSMGSARIGAAIRFAWTRDLGVELEMDYRRGEMHALGSNVSLVYDLPRIGRIVPYLTGGVGFEQYGTALELPGLGVVTQPRLAFTVNAGGGVRVPVGENWEIRTDARWSNGIGAAAPERWRLYNGVTFRHGGK